MPIKQNSPLDYLRNKSPRNIVRQLRRLEDDMSERQNRNIEAENADEMTINAGGLTLDGGARVDGGWEITPLNIVSHAVEYTYTAENLPEGALVENNIVEVELIGEVLNNTGGNLTLIITWQIGSPSLIAGISATIPTGTTYRSFRFRGRAQQLANLEDIILPMQELQVEGGTPKLQASAYEITNIADEQPMIFKIEYIGSPTTNFRIILDSLSVRLLDGIGGETKRFWTQPETTRGYDTFITDFAPTTNNGNSVILRAGEIDTGSVIRRTLIRMPDINNIPTNAIIDSAKLWLCVQADLSSNTRTYEVYRVVRNWVQGDGTAGSGATWNTYNGVNNWTTAGCGHSTSDYDGSVVWASTSFGAAIPLGTMKVFNLNVTEFQKFVDGTYPNYGWLIKAQTETDDGYDFHSADSATLTLAPLLEVAYHMP